MMRAVAHYLIATGMVYLLIAMVCYITATIWHIGRADFYGDGPYSVRDGEDEEPVG
jgi:hypothetical protein